MKQTPYVGFEVVSYRNIYDGNDKLLSSTVEAKSSYKARDKIILVGINGRPPLEAEPTPPPVILDPSAPTGGTGIPSDPGTTGPGTGGMPGGTDEPTAPPAPSQPEDPAPPPVDDQPPDWL